MGMSKGEIRARYQQLNKKSSLSRSERGELAVCRAVLFNGGMITTQADHTEPGQRKSTRRGWW